MSQDMQFVVGAQESRVIGTYADYLEAQAVVDRLSDAQFDVSKIQIIGQGLKTVEQVVGRMTTGKAAAYGAASGAWFGLFLGLMMGIFTPGISWLWVILTPVLVGALFGAVMGAIDHASKQGQRDFASMKALSAETYVVSVEAQYYNEAMSKLNGGQQPTPQAPAN